VLELIGAKGSRICTPDRILGGRVAQLWEDDGRRVSADLYKAMHCEFGSGLVSNLFLAIELHCLFPSQATGNELTGVGHGGPKWINQGSSDLPERKSALIW